MNLLRHALLAVLFATPGAIQAAAQEPLRVGPVEAVAADKATGHLSALMADGSVTRIPVSIVHGATPGPVLALIAGTHGTEYTPMLALQWVLRELDPAALRGSVIMVHMANPSAFYGRRLAKGDTDDLNDRFPGDFDGTASERIAWALSQTVHQQATHLIDMHAGDGNEILDGYAYLIATGDSTLDAAARAMVLAYGMDRILIESAMHPNEDRSRFFTDSYALSLGKPAFLPEFGGLMTTDPRHVDKHVAGVRSVMAHLGMLEGDVLAPADPVFFESSDTLHADHPGLWQPLATARQVVEEGALLGRITDAFGNTLQELRAPHRGEVLSVLGTPPVAKGESVVLLGRQHQGQP